MTSKQNVQEPANVSAEYWEAADYAALEEAQRIADMTAIGLRVAARMPQPVGDVCGPISNGGVGSIEGNLKVFRQTITRLTEEGNTIFDQMPFEEHIHRVVHDEFGQGAKTELLEGFYRPLFESGSIKRLYFITGWESSDGARWEHEAGQQLGLEIIYLADHWG